MKKSKTIVPLLLSLLLLVALPACGSNKQEYAHKFLLYYVNNDETGILPREYQTDSQTIEAQVAELLTMLKTIPEKLEYKSPLAGNFELLEYQLLDGQITLNFNDYYNDQPIITEILVRASIVRTLTQVEGIDNVVMTIRGEPLIDRTGNIVGSMNADLFIDNVGNELNAYEKTNLRLYFADENNEGLKIVNRGDVIYHSNIAIERLVVEHLIEGPQEMEAVLATLNPGTRILGITTTDGTCYVNLDENFIQQPQGISAELVIYSIVNSLIELPTVNRVRILLHGEAVVFETVNLATVFERNLDIVSSN